MVSTQTTEAPGITREWLLGLTPEQYKEGQGLLWAKAKHDPLEFCRCWAYTNDPHRPDDPIRLMPAGRPHLTALIRLWQREPRIVICKSRQMMMTWLFCALALWDAMFHRGRLIMLQSKREEDAVGDEVSADGLLGRVKFILAHLPPEMLPEYRPTYNKIVFPKLNSTIWAIPQGADIIRQKTASGILSDEAGFQDEFEGAYTASLPCVRGGGWFVAVSTAHPGFFDKLRLDQV